MIVLGIDPGKRSGWCLYNSSLRSTEASGEFDGSDLDIAQDVRPTIDRIVLERPRGHGPTRPEMVECGITFGELHVKLSQFGSFAISWLYREQVRHELTIATHGVVSVRNDATAWAALVLLHGEGSDKKPRTRRGKVIEQGGTLGSVKGHARAALAVAVAYVLSLQPQPDRIPL